MSQSFSSPLIATQIASAMELLGDMPETLPPAVEQAGQKIAQCLLADGTLFIAGTGQYEPLMRYFHGLVACPPSAWRPALPALLLNIDARGLDPSADADRADAPPDSLMARSLMALAKAGDTLCIACNQTDDSSVAELVQLAHDKQLHCVVLHAGNDGGQATASTHRTALQLPGIDNHRQHLAALFVVQCLHAIIDQEIFGGL